MDDFVDTGTPTYTDVDDGAEGNVRLEGRAWGLTSRCGCRNDCSNKDAGNAPEDGDYATLSSKRA